MEIYCTKKAENVDDFVFDIPEGLPYLHIKTPEVIIKCYVNGCYYIADCPTDASFLTNFIKCKKVIAKKAACKGEKEGDKLKLQDDVIWLKPSPIMIYQKRTVDESVKSTKLILNHPVALQLSFSQEDVYYMGKPYNTFNISFTCDKVTVQDDFPW
jgi:hypothetical protein